MRILTSQKDAIFKVIADKEFFKPSQFSIRESNTFRINYKNTDYFFSIHDSSRQPFLSYSPAEQIFQNTEFFGDWDEVVLKFDVGLMCLQRELQAPNYWEQLSNQLSLINLSHDEKGEKFSVQEYQLLVQKVDHVIDEMRSIPLLQEEQLSKIEYDLKRVVVLAESLSKIDWRNLFIGTLINCIMGLEVTNDVVSAIWAVVRQVFKGYFLF